MTASWLLLSALVSLLAGGVASVSGFGIGSLLTPLLAAVFGGLLVFAGVAGLTGLAARLRFRGAMGWMAGALSGLLGGLVGNQGGIRAAALMGFDVPRQAFVATATAVGLLVDAARVPVYLATQGGDILRVWPFVAVGTGGVVVGTLAGGRVLQRVPEPTFRRVVSSALALLGLATLRREGGW